MYTAKNLRQVLTYVKCAIQCSMSYVIWLFWRVSGGEACMSVLKKRL